MNRARGRPDLVRLLYRALGAYYTVVLVLLCLLAVVASATGQGDVAVLVLVLGGAPLTLRYLVRRFDARR